MIHEPDEVAFHVTPLGLPSVIVPVPPADEKLCSEILVIVHAVGGGGVVVVPQFAVALAVACVWAWACAWASACACALLTASSRLEASIVTVMVTLAEASARADVPFGHVTLAEAVALPVTVTVNDVGCGGGGGTTTVGPVGREQLSQSLSQAATPNVDTTSANTNRLRNFIASLLLVNEEPVARNEITGSC